MGGNAIKLNLEIVALCFLLMSNPLSYWITGYAPEGMVDWCREHYLDGTDNPPCYLSFKLERIEQWHDGYCSDYIDADSGEYETFVYQIDTEYYMRVPEELKNGQDCIDLSFVDDKGRLVHCPETADFFEYIPYNSCNGSGVCTSKHVYRIKSIQVCR